MSVGRNCKLVGQVGEYLVCAELGKRGLIATPFAGNVPTFDLLIADEACRTLPIKVKTSAGDSWPRRFLHGRSGIQFAANREGMRAPECDKDANSRRDQDEGDKSRDDPACSTHPLPV